MNKQDVFEIGLGLIIGFIVYLAVSFTLWELNITKWHWIGRAMWVLISVGGYLSVDIIWEEDKEDEE